MTLNDRQKAILCAVIDEFIASAEPVASGRIVHKYHFHCSPATVRNDFLELDEQGFLRQPHTSAGRIPTDKGYRFYADAVSSTGKTTGRAQKMFAELNRVTEEDDFIRNAARAIAELSHSVACAGFLDEDIFYKSGFADAFDEPEFDDGDARKNFAALIDDIDSMLAEMAKDALPHAPRVFIGAENPIIQAREYSMLVSSFATPFQKNGVVGIVGPKRMDYQNNLRLLQELETLW